MNYIKLHNTAVEYFRNTDPRQRILKRNPQDSRIKDESIYVEIHHIIPRSLGGLDELDNLVEVLPEEHIFLHMLRYKIYRKREDMLAVRFMLNGFDSKNISKGSHAIVLTKKLRMGYAWLRTHAQQLRATEGWQTPDGVKRISESKKGKMVAKDAVTGEPVGLVSLADPKVISGEWVHHSKGRRQSKKEIDQKRKKFKGQGNPNASGLSEDYFLEKGMEAFKEFGFILGWPAMLRLSQRKGFSWIKTLKSRFEGRGAAGYIQEMEKLTGATYIIDKRRNKI